MGLTAGAIVLLTVVPALNGYYQLDRKLNAVRNSFASVASTSRDWTTDRAVALANAIIGEGAGSATSSERLRIAALDRLRN